MRWKKTCHSLAIPCDSFEGQVLILACCWMGTWSTQGQLIHHLSSSPGSLGNIETLYTSSSPRPYNCRPKKVVKKLLLLRPNRTKSTQIHEFQGGFEASPTASPIFSAHQKNRTSRDIGACAARGTCLGDAHNLPHHSHGVQHWQGLFIQDPMGRIQDMPLRKEEIFVAQEPTPEVVFDL